jgi:phenylacetate-CoA ligase
MGDRLLRAYHRLPPRTRSIAATLRGLYLRSWRYAAESERLVAEARDRESWSSERWKTWQQDQLGRILHRALTRVPYYREQWALRRRAGDLASWVDLENWPVLEKDALRRNPRAFIADDCTTKSMFHEHTSGTTGKPLDLWWSRKTVRAWYALFELRSRIWYGVSRQDRWAMLGGQLVTPTSQRSPPLWVWNAGLNQLYMSSYHLSPDLIPYYFDAMKRHRIKYIFGYTSSLYALALEALQSGRRDLQMTVAITNAEPVFGYQRAVIAEAFQCPVRETYGMAEIVCGASECAAGSLHLWPETGWVDVCDDAASRNISPSELICTSLLNADMPLIRYRVGDRATLPSEAAPCPCGRTLPTIRSVEGRTDDVLYTADGRRVGRLDPVFKSNLPIREAQIVQESLTTMRVRYVPTPAYTSAAGHSIVQRLQDRLGAVEVLLEPVRDLPREKNGKFRAVICNLTPEQRHSHERKASP